MRNHFDSNPLLNSQLFRPKLSGESQPNRSWAIANWKLANEYLRRDREMCLVSRAFLLGLRKCNIDNWNEKHRNSNGNNFVCAIREMKKMWKMFSLQFFLLLGFPHNNPSSSKNRKKGLKGRKKLRLMPFLKGLNFVDEVRVRIEPSGMLKNEKKRNFPLMWRNFPLSLSLVVSRKTRSNKVEGLTN